MDGRSTLIRLSPLVALLALCAGYFTALSLWDKVRESLLVPEVPGGYHALQEDQWTDREP